MSSAFVESIGMIAPGLPSWQASVPILRGNAHYVSAQLTSVQPGILPPNERRRAPLTVRLALRAAEDAIAGSSIAATELASVFASSDGDLAILHRICAALSEPERAVSPTDFHNSVHNAASGYWSIATAVGRPSTTISAYDFIFAAALRESLAMLNIDDMDVLLVLYDAPPPEPIYAKRPIAQPVAVAFTLSRQRTARSLARISLCEAPLEHTMDDAALETLRLANPAARALPLLQMLAAHGTGIVAIRADDDHCVGIRVEIP